ncbi:aldose epimerase family protein [Alkalitalea saponilacus]|uniref:Aldose 1-epimerase n=1 Tax=Alkalitalea saponilacus TaxID=889453 RepID=A0A1T5A8T9_9BACT|nr:aldose epimerase family protein [Alkalitalea saponilacus]ASB48796.1 galactose-1-epimerase [Alkalitalea saponilacus]SKB31340.1 aldose 1-epimerase [Alkalitalea saponilacus]
MKTFDIIKEELFEATVNGKKTSLFTLRNKNGLVAQITNFGATIVSIYAPNKKGEFADIVLGFDNVEDYINGNGSYMGVLCGRCANRIANGKFELEGKVYNMAVNNGPNHLHGGVTGFNKVVWDVESLSENKVVLTYFSEDGEENYPGNVTAKVTYTLTEENELVLDYEASTDKTTLVNFASHSYFNLGGEGSGKALDHQLMINSDYFTPIDDTSIPTGEILKVAGTPMDFSTAKPIGEDLFKEDLQLKNGGGYDHNWILKNRAGEMVLAAVAHDPASGRVMEIHTTQPGIQFYSSNWMENEKGKHGNVYNKHEGFCLETQHFPDSINHAHFPSVILKPGDVYKHSCIHKFLIK